jgi:tetratricopeptide (TPR) repeat protein
MPAERSVRKLQPELENIRAALEWALSIDDVTLAAAVAAGHAAVWTAARGAIEPRRWLETILPRLDGRDAPMLAARAWRALAAVTVGTRKIEAAQRALAAGEACDEPVDKAWTLYQLAWGLMNAGRGAEAESAIARAVRIYEENGLARSFHYASALDMQANIAAALGRIDDARRFYNEKLSVATDLEGEQEAAITQINLAELEFRLENRERALELVEAAMATLHGAGLRDFRILALLNVAAYRLVLGRADAAAAPAREALSLARNEQLHGAAIAIQHLATVGAVRGDVQRAARLRGYVDAWYRAEGCEREFTEQRTYDILMPALQEKLAAGDLERLAGEGAELSEDEAAADALTI